MDDTRLGLFFLQLTAVLLVLAYLTLHPQADDDVVNMFIKLYGASFAVFVVTYLAYCVYPPESHVN